MVLALFADSPYGKLASTKVEDKNEGFIDKILNFAVKLDPRFGWWLMELPATLSFGYFYLQGANAFQPVPLLLAGLWAKHYLNRGWLFPLNIRVSNENNKGETPAASFSIWVVSFGVIFTTMHGYLNAKWFSSVGTHLTKAWLSDWRFITGLIIYETSYWATIHCEHILRNLRSSNPSPNEPRYKIPKGGLFEYCTSPQYLCELLAWFGWSLISVNPGGVIVFLVSAANLIPRAYTQHEWYLKKFKEDYPKERKRLIPFIW